MKFFTKISGLFRRSRVPKVRATGVWNPRGGDYEWLSPQPPMSVATVYRCVKLLCDSVGQLPMRYMRLRDGVYTEDTDSRLHYLLSVQPCPGYIPFDLFSRIVYDITMHGNAYIYPEYSGLELLRLVPLNPKAVSHDTTNDLYTVSDSENGVAGTFTEDSILHIKGLGLNPKHGLSVLEYARLTCDIAATGDRETYNRFANGGDVRGIVSNAKGVQGFGEYQDAELKKTAKSLDERWKAGERIVATPGDVSFQQTSLTSADMQFLESRKFTVRDLCRFFGVHPSFVFDDTSNNYKSAEMANTAFLINTLNPLLVKIESEFYRKLVPDALKGKYRFRFDRSGIYANDLAAKADYYAKLIATGLATVNELRHRENLPSVEGGDTVFLSANLKNITEYTDNGNEENYKEGADPVQ